MLNKMASEARKSIIKMIYEAKSGHPGGSLSCIDILMYLYQKELKLTKDERCRYVNGIIRAGDKCSCWNHFGK